MFLRLTAETIISDVLYFLEYIRTEKRWPGPGGGGGAWRNRVTPNHLLLKKILKGGDVDKNEGWIVIEQIIVGLKSWS